MISGKTEQHDCGQTGRKRSARKMLTLLVFPFATMNAACSSDANSAQRGKVRQMQVSPQLHDPSYYAGAWTITGDGGACGLTLSADRVESANAHALTDDQECLQRVLGRPVAGWRPATDGIDFSGPDRLSVGFFSFEGDVAVLRKPGGRLILTRAR